MPFSGKPNPKHGNHIGENGDKFFNSKSDKNLGLVNDVNSKFLQSNQNVKKSEFGFKSEKHLPNNVFYNGKGKTFNSIAEEELLYDYESYNGNVYAHQVKLLRKLHKTLNNNLFY